MFEPTSRYAALPTRTWVGPDGRIVTYVARRFVPPPESFDVLVEVALERGDRLDTLAARALGSPEAWFRIADANEVLDPEELSAAGIRVRIPIPRP
jgi:nucleoid-associated protein YgaU